MEKLPELFSMRELMGKVEERTPYVIVCFQECERMNLLVAEMRRSLKELDLGLKGELTITSDMEALSDSLFFDQVNIQYTMNTKGFQILFENKNHQSIKKLVPKVDKSFSAHCHCQYSAARLYGPLI